MAAMRKLGAKTKQPAGQRVRLYHLRFVVGRHISCKGLANVYEFSCTPLLNYMIGASLVVDWLL